MKYKSFALLLVTAVLFGSLGGCSRGKTSAPSQTDETFSAQPTAARAEAETVSAKFAYQAQYLDIPVQTQYISAFCVSGDALYFCGSVVSGQETYTDELTGETYTYDSFENKLFRMDLTTLECGELAAYTPAKAEEGWLGEAYVQNMCAGTDGTVWLCEQMHTYRYNVPEDFDPENDNEHNYYEQGQAIIRMVQLDADGQILTEITVDEQTLGTDEGGFYMDAFIVDANGYVYGGNWETTAVWDRSGALLHVVDMSENGGELVQYSSTEVGVMTYGEEYGVKLLDPKTGKLGAVLPLPEQAYRIFPGDGTYDLFYEYNGKIYGYVARTDTSEKVVDWLESDVNSNDIDHFSVLPDGRVVAPIHQWSQSGGSNTQIVLLTPVDAAELPEKTVLTLACLYMDWELRSLIVDFNRSSSEYRIVVRDYSEYNTNEDYTAGLTKLNTEMLAGVMPDILLTGQMPVSRYAAKGLLVDLWPFIDADAQLGRDALMTGVLQAAEVDGKLYELPSTFQLQSVAGLGKVVGDYDTWTLDDLFDAMDRLQPGATIFSETDTKQTVLQNCLAQDMNSYIDWSTGACHFDSEQFLQLLQLANALPAEFDYENYDWETDYESDHSRMLQGKQLLTTVYFYDFQEIYTNFVRLGDDPCFVGYPSAQAGSKSAFSFSGSLAITSACSDPAAAWEFVRTVVLDDYQQNVYGMPVNRRVFDSKMAEAMVQEYKTDAEGNWILDENGEPIKISKGGIGYGNEDMIEIYAVTEEQRDAFMELLESSTGVFSYDEKVMEIILEETAPYFAGEKGAPETVNAIQNRVRLYVAEQM